MTKHIRHYPMVIENRFCECFATRAALNSMQNQTQTDSLCAEQLVLGAWMIAAKTGFVFPGSMLTSTSQLGLEAT